MARTNRAERQAIAVYRFIIEHKETHDGNSPTYQQIGEGCNISTSMVTFYLARLEADGKIARIHHRIHVVGGRWRLEREKE
jgi:hypothetical protein